MDDSLRIDVEPMAGFFTKFHLRGPWPFPLVIHRFTSPDHGDPHDHPWSFQSTILAGGYVEEVFEPETWRSELVTHRAGDSFRVEAGHVHRIVELLEPVCYTLIQPGSHDRTPGFYRREGEQTMHRFWHGDFHPWHRSA